MEGRSIAFYYQFLANAQELQASQE